MRAMYSTNKSNAELLKFFADKYAVLESNVLEFLEGEVSVIKFVRVKKELFIAVIKGSVIYVNNHDSPMPDMLTAGWISFSFSQYSEVPDRRIEEYFFRNGK